MSLSGRGISNIVKRNIIGGIGNIGKGNFIRGIRWNDFGNKRGTGSSVGGNKNMLIGSNVSLGIIDRRGNVSGGKGVGVVIIRTGIGIGDGARTVDGDIVDRKRRDWLR